MDGAKFSDRLRHADEFDIVTCDHLVPVAAYFLCLGHRDGKLLTFKAGFQIYVERLMMAPCKICHWKASRYSGPYCAVHRLNWVLLDSVKHRKEPHTRQGNLDIFRQTSPSTFTENRQRLMFLSN